MKFALYQPWIYLRGGLERSLLELVTRSRHEWTVYTSHYEPENTFEGFAKVRVIELPRVTVNREMFAVLGAAWRIARQKLPLAGMDGLVIWCDGLGDLIAFRNRGLPIFNICSTPLRAAFDPVYERQACARYAWPKRALYALFKHSFRMADRRAWRLFAGVVVTSAEVKRRVLAGGLCVEGPRLRLFYPGIDWQAANGRASYEPFLLAPGRIMWTKNLELAVEAFVQAALPAPWRLVIAGFVDAKSGGYLEALRQSAQRAARIEFVASPSDAVLADLYARASAVLFPPLNEDWGIVPLEAMAHCKPVLANAAGGPLESVRDNLTGWLRPPDAAAWAGVLREI
ncbi:MAG: glycosyltransferase, partial [Planctomycetota bacterium]